MRSWNSARHSADLGRSNPADAVDDAVAQREFVDGSSFFAFCRAQDSGAREASEGFAHGAGWYVQLARNVPHRSGRILKRDQFQDDEKIRWLKSIHCSTFHQR